MRRYTESEPFPEFSPRTRARNIERLKNELFDILVIGGGITGAGIARDAVLRGFRTALIEKGDYASGTSSRSSRLIHGGLRYLENWEFHLVFEACAERRRLRRIAPHLVKPLPFILPVYQDSARPYWEIRLGMWLYDLLALFRNIKLHRALKSQEILRLEPAISPRGLVGGARFYDCKVDDARLTLATVQSAHRYGAVAVSHAQVYGFIKERGRICGARVHDALTGRRFEVRARVVISAAGPWTDRIAALDNPRAERRLRLTKGIHIVVPRHRIGNRNAVAFVSPRDRRLMFLIPWGTYAIIGTTDTDYEGDLERVHAEADDVAYVLEAFNKAFPDVGLTTADILSTYAGVRPLIDEKVPSAYKVSREHRIFESPSGLLSIAGGKLTTYRLMAKQMVDLAARRLTREFDRVAQGRSKTGRLPLEGGVRRGFVRVAAQAREAARAYRLPDDVVSHLLTAYGVGYTRVLGLIEADEALAEPIVEELPYIWAEVPHAIQYEMALTLDDFLVRRTHVIYEAEDQGVSRAGEVAERMAPFLGWGPQEIERQVERYAEGVALTRMYKR